MSDPTLHARLATAYAVDGDRLRVEETSDGLHKAVITLGWKTPHEDTVRAITHAWMAHLGYTPEQIAEGEKERDHSLCDLSEGGPGCIDEDGQDRHPIHREMDTTAEMVLFVLEHAAAAGERA